MEHARTSMSPGRRGYFTPQEDDAVRQMLLSYRNYRRALWEIIHRHKSYARRDMRDLRLRGFVIGYCAALALYRRSLRLMEVVEADRALRSKLNEPDGKFGLEGGFFEDVLLSYTSIYNYLKVAQAHLYRLAKRRLIRALCATDADCRLFTDTAVADRARVERRLLGDLSQAAASRLEGSATHAVSAAAPRAVRIAGGARHRARVATPCAGSRARTDAWGPRRYSKHGALR